jgi:hypothetical protein
MLEDALRYPWQGEDRVETIGIGGGLTFVFAYLSFLLLPLLAMFPVMGYLVRLIREVRAGAEVPPTFGDWEALFSDGLKVFVIGFAYTLVPIILYAVLFFGFLAGVAGATQADLGGVSVLVTLVVLVLGLVAFVVSLLVGYVLPAGIYEFARTEEVGAAFKLGQLRAIVMTREYAVGWLVGVAALFIGNVIANLLSIVLIGLLLFPWILFYVYVSATYAVTQGVMDARGEQPAEEVDAGTPDEGDQPAAEPS